MCPNPGAHRRGRGPGRKAGPLLLRPGLRVSPARAPRGRCSGSGPEGGSQGESWEGRRFRKWEQGVSGREASGGRAVAGHSDVRDLEGHRRGSPTRPDSGGRDRAEVRGATGRGYRSEWAWSRSWASGAPQFWGHCLAPSRGSLQTDRWMEGRTAVPALARRFPMKTCTQRRGEGYAGGPSGPGTLCCCLAHLDPS